MAWSWGKFCNFATEIIKLSTNAHKRQHRYHTYV